jgi:hypothetical protein
MNEYDPTRPHETPSARPDSSEFVAAHPPKVRRSRSKTKRRRVAAAALMCAALGLSVGLATSASASATQQAARSGSNARSGPAAGGSSGTVDSVSTSSFTLTTSAGQKVTVDETSSTKYQTGTSSTSTSAIKASAIKKGEAVLVLGTTSGTTIKATQVIVQTTGDSGSAASSSAEVIPFQRGASTASTQVGEIPAGYSEGSGTIVGGTTANKATKAALAAYPGGIVDRVVKLGDGEYEVHSIGVNWPHHVFVNQDFEVVGAK